MTASTPNLLRLVRASGILRPRDLPPSIPRQYLRLAEQQGLLRRIARGLYTAVGANSPPDITLAEAAKRIDHGVICLLSALQFHELTTQAPFQVWMAIDVKARRPHVPDLPLRFVRFSGRALTSEIQTHRINGVTVRIYSPAKSVADCFKYRNKIGLDIALEALRDCYRKRKATLDQLHHAAQICRVANVIRPYLESLT